MHNNSSTGLYDWLVHANCCNKMRDSLNVWCRPQPMPTLMNILSHCKDTTVDRLEWT